MVKVLLLSFSLAFFGVQAEYHVDKIWLFSKVQYPGNVPVNRDGKQLLVRSSKLICYIKLGRKKEAPDWQTAFICGNRYSVEAVPVTQDSIAVGALKNSSTYVTVKADTGARLVQLVFTKQGKIEKPEAWQFILNGTLNGKPVYLRSNDPIVELQPDLMP